MRNTTHFDLVITKDITLNLLTDTFNGLYDHKGIFNIFSNYEHIDLYYFAQAVISSLHFDDLNRY
jgi:hypothetical protein